MAIIVDKVQKRRDIALSCKDLFIQKGLKDLTISEVAKTAGIGKGTVYEYFENKEDIIFEIANLLMTEHRIHKEQLLLSLDTTREKVKAYLNFYYNPADVELRNIYKEFIAASIISPSAKMIKFQTELCSFYAKWLGHIIQEGIDKGELIPESIQFTQSIFSVGDGLFISNIMTNNYLNIEYELNNYIDTLFTLIEVKS